MTKTMINFAFFLLGIIGCTGNQQDKLLVVDVTKSYPKEELTLQDFMDVEYLALETNDEFLVQGNVAAVGEKFLIVTNMRQGDILLFDRVTGKYVRKINRKGNGPGEYVLPFNISLNEKENIMYVNDGPSSNIQVYDLEGEYKRTIPYRKGALVTSLFDFDANHFLSQDIYAEGNKTFASTFFLMSKQNGERMDISVPFEKRISPVITKRVGDKMYGSSPRIGFISSYQGNWSLAEPSADTIYTYRSNQELCPFIVRTPSVQVMNPEQFLFPGLLSNRYFFMQVVTKECDFEKDQEMPAVDLAYDRQTGKIFQSTVYNGDYEGREEKMSVSALGEDVAFAAKLEAFDLIEANKDGKLRGRLKEMASKLNSEDNPVIMLVKLRK